MPGQKPGVLLFWRRGRPGDAREQASATAEISRFSSPPVMQVTEMTHFPYMSVTCISGCVHGMAVQPSARFSCFMEICVTCVIRHHPVIAASPKRPSTSPVTTSERRGIIDGR